MGTQKYVNQVFKCAICGNVIEVLHGATGTFRCCKEPMDLLETNNVEFSNEKHKPEITSEGPNSVVKVGSIPHPMEEDHYIEWIEIINKEYVNRRYMKPNERPEARFYVDKQHGMKVRAYCNKHGLWETEC